MFVKTIKIKKKKNRYFAENCRWVPLMLEAAKGIMDKKEESKL